MSPRDAQALAAALQRIDGRGYPAYKDIRGDWHFGDFTLSVDHVQGDPFAAPSRVRVRIPGAATGLPPVLCAPGPRALGLACHLARAFARGARKAGGGQGSGKSGEVRVESPGQEVLAQTAVQVASDGALEARFTVGLPAAGRRVLGRVASTLLTRRVPALVEETLVARAHDLDDLARAARVNEDAEALRAALPALGLLAFVADGAVLPRRSGVDDRPLEGEGVVPFSSPDSLRVTVELPNAGPVTGMGVSVGVTVIVGGGYHGKSTLLRALERGVYNHRPGDGRERVVTDPAAVKVRAEDGRSVAGVDLSPFITNLPRGQDTRAFSTENASGSTSQAAAIMEAMEAGATALLVDEDTAATNFMIRDRRMQALVPREGEPITPFVDRVRQLHDERGVSTVLVIGGSGDYLEVADTVLALRDYRTRDVTPQAAEVVADLPTGRMIEAVGPLPRAVARAPRPESLDPRRGKREVSVRARSLRRIEFGRTDIDLAAVEQLVDASQTRAIAGALALAHARFVDGRSTLGQVLDRVLAAVVDQGFDVLDPRGVGDLAAFRRFELSAALNRLRGLEVRAASGEDEP